MPIPGGKNIKLVFLILILIIIFTLGVFLGNNFAERAGNGEVKNKDAEQAVYLERDVDFRMFWQVWNIVLEKFYDQPVSETRLFYGALQGMVASLEDPYTVFFTPDEADEFAKDLEGQFEGIGAEIGIKHDMLTIIAPVPESPAERAGLRPGDKVLAIDGLDTTGITVDRAVSLIRGEAGTEVVLTIWREESEDTFDVVITRGKIDMVSVRTTTREDGIAYLEIFSFAEDTEDLFEEAVDEIIDSGARAIILDLRGNSGGYLQSAVDVAGHWIGEQLITVERDSEGNETVFYGEGRPRLADIPTVVLVNRGTASGSEILAGALRDYDLAILVGEKTFGKGSVQEMEILKDGSAVKVTVAEWLTPNGFSFNEEGIVPDYEIEYGEDDYNEDRDPPLDKAVEILIGQ